MGVVSRPLSRGSSFLARRSCSRSRSAVSPAGVTSGCRHWPPFQRSSWRGLLFSLIGDGASNRAGALTWFAWLAFVAFQLLKKTEEREPELLAARWRDRCAATL